jgi:hypothetical protein
VRVVRIEYVLIAVGLAVGIFLAMRDTGAL